MGALVKTAQAVEDRFGEVRREVEPMVRSKLREARTEWVELKARGNGSRIRRTELRLKAYLMRTDARLRLETAKLIGRAIQELEKMKRNLPRDA